MRVAVLASLLLSLGGCSMLAEAVVAPADALLSSPTDQMHRIDVTDEDGGVQAIEARVCRTAPDIKSAAKLPVAIINHGGPASGEDRTAMTPAGCDSAPVRWFLARHYAVVLPMRRGYGPSEGGWAQNPGSCASPDYVRSALEGGRDLDAVVTYVLALPYAKADGLVLVGEGEGGWAVLGYASQPSSTPAAVIDLAGGMGGRAANEFRRTCRPDLLVDAAGELGRQSRDRMLWIFATDDDVFSPELATDMFTAFTHAGGKAELAQPADVGDDSHDLLFKAEGERIWAPLFAKFLDA